ncbi:hypothetical protein TNCV_4255151 [Trichonephila clavipes]|nr:hypothetical protein TNCV_4255151 [Trichonephila clavipes]
MLGQHVMYKINFVVLSLVFFGVAFTVASSVVAFPSGEFQHVCQSPKQKKEGEKKLTITNRGDVGLNLKRLIPNFENFLIEAPDSSFHLKAFARCSVVLCIN